MGTAARSTGDGRVVGRPLRSEIDDGMDEAAARRWVDRVLLALFPATEQPARHEAQALVAVRADVRRQRHHLERQGASASTIAAAIQALLGERGYGVIAERVDRWD